MNWYKISDRKIDEISIDFLFINAAVFYKTDNPNT